MLQLRLASGLAEVLAARARPAEPVVTGPADAEALWSPCGPRPPVPTAAQAARLAAIGRVVEPLPAPAAGLAGEPAQDAVRSGAGPVDPRLTSEQARIVRACRRPGLVVFKGPPGTGKTTVGAAVVADAVASGHRTLITAQTATALAAVTAQLPAHVRRLCVGPEDPEAVVTRLLDLRDTAGALPPLAAAPCEPDPPGRVVVPPRSPLGPTTGTPPIDVGAARLVAAIRHDPALWGPVRPASAIPPPAAGPVEAAMAVVTGVSGPSPGHAATLRQAAADLSVADPWWAPDGLPWAQADRFAGLLAPHADGLARLKVALANLAGRAVTAPAMGAVAFGAAAEVLAARNHAVRLDGAGRVRCGPLTPQAVRDAAWLPAACLVDGVPPTRPADFRTVLAWAAAVQSCDDLDALVGRPTAGQPISGRAAYHQALHERATVVQAALRRLAGLSPTPSTCDPSELARLADRAEADRSRIVRADAQALLERLTAAHADRTDLSAALRDRDPARWAAAHAADVADRARQALHRRRDAALARLAGHPQALDALLEGTVGPDRFAAVWAHARQLTVLAALPDQPRDERSAAGVAFDAWQAALSGAVWAARLDHRAATDLREYVRALERYGKGTSVRADRLAADVTSAAAAAAAHLPVTALTVTDAARRFADGDRWDVIVIDEASQLDGADAWLFAAADTVVVAGDDQQVCPANVGTPLSHYDSPRSLAERHGLRHPAMWADPSLSVYQVARQATDTQHALTDHHRCVPSIIGFCDDIAYRPSGTPLRVLTPPAVSPSWSVAFLDGVREGDTNPVEANAAVCSVEAALATDPTSTVAVVSLLGADQADLIDGMLTGRGLAGDARVTVGTAADVQGHEYDTVVVTLVQTGGPAVTRPEARRRYNVAVSRARRRVVVLTSLDPTSLTNPQDLRRRLIRHATDPTTSGAVLPDGALACSHVPRTAVVPHPTASPGGAALLADRLARLGWAIASPSPATVHARLSLGLCPCGQHRTPSPSNHPVAARVHTDRQREPHDA